ncbi:hypothetical protein GCM10009527_083030 [Actinomadura nitritigenes]
MISETLPDLLKRGGRYWVRTSDLFGVNTIDRTPGSQLPDVTAGQTQFFSAAQRTSKKIKSLVISHY